MSFGISVGDFLAVGRLASKLWISFKDAPKELASVEQQLSSINILIASISDQAENPTSPLNRRGSDRRTELLRLRDNLNDTLKELQDLHQKYQNMGHNVFMRMRFGLEDLPALSTKLGTHISAISVFLNSLILASVGRTEPLTEEVLKTLRRLVKGHGPGVSSLLEAQSTAVGTEPWGILERALESERIPPDFIQDHSDDIRTLLTEVLEEDGFRNLEEIRPEDSRSQINQSQYANLSRETTHKPSSLDVPLSEEDIKAATRSIKSYGYDIERVFLQITSDQREYSNNALCRAAAGGNLAAISLFASKGVSVNAVNCGDSRSPLYCAIVSDCSDARTLSTVKLLTQLGGDLSFSTKAWLSHNPYQEGTDGNLLGAVKRRKLETARYILENDAWIQIDQVVSTRKSKQDTALCKAASLLDAPMVELLLQHKASVNQACESLKESKLMARDKFWRRNALGECRRAEGGIGSKTEKILTDAGAILIDEIIRK